MTDLQATARRAVGAKLVADQIKDIEKQAKAELLERMQKLGVRTLDVAGTGDSNMAVISKTPGKVTAKVTDERALLEWVKANRPDQLRTLVEEAYVKSLLTLAAEHGAAVDEATGEVIPGIEVETGEPFLSTRPTAEAKARMKDLLAGSPLLELAGGETDA
jgi:hypothetical protein